MQIRRSPQPGEHLSSKIYNHNAEGDESTFQLGSVLTVTDLNPNKK
jgi:hypothetical protein